MSLTAAEQPTAFEAALAELRALADARVGPKRVRYCPYVPTPKQDWFLCCPEFEAFFGGAAGPGKSWGLLMAALQYADEPGYHALLLRPTLTEFEQPGALIPTSEEWLAGYAHWNGSARAWTFPSGATVRFGYLKNLGDLARYKGPSYSFVGFDELTSFGADDRLYRAMFRVLRQSTRLEGIPLRMRAASNPGDVGHQWVKDRFVNPKTRDPGVVYVRALIGDNPFLDYDTYVNVTLAHLSPVDRARLISGDWDVAEEGQVFDRLKLRVVAASSVDPPFKQCRYWDMAATTPSPSNPDPDWSIGVRLEMSNDGIFTVRHIARFRLDAADGEKRMAQVAADDGPRVGHWVEQEPGASGKNILSHYKRNVFRGYICHAGLVNSGNKETRARPVAAAVGNGLVQIVDGCPNINEFLDELAIFPQGNHDDCVDGLSGSHTALARGITGPSRISVPRGQLPSVPLRGVAGSPGVSDIIRTGR